MITLFQLRSRNDGKYLSQDGFWRIGSKGARAFVTSSEAVAICKTEGLKDVELVIKRPDQPALHVPITNR